MLFRSNVAVAQAYIADVTPPPERARAMGLIGMAFGLGFILGPFVGGLLAHLSLALPGLVAAGLALANLGLAWRRLPESLPPRDAAAPAPAAVSQVIADTVSLRAVRRVLALPGSRLPTSYPGIRCRMWCWRKIPSPRIRYAVTP